MWMWISRFILCLTISQAIVTDEEYALMPPVYHYDDYDRCMLLGTNSIYSTVLLELSPLNIENPSAVWKTIQEINRLPQNFQHHKLKYGVCLRESCKGFTAKNDMDTTESLRRHISDCYSDKFNDIGLKASVTKMHVQKGGLEGKPDGIGTFSMSCYLGGAILIIWGTVRDCMSRSHSRNSSNTIIKPSSFDKVLSCFSLRKNWEILFSEFQTEEASALKCIQGIRFFTMMSILITHTNTAVGMAGIVNTRYLESMLAKPAVIVLFYNLFAVQPFFVVSAWLLSYNFFLLIENEKLVKVQYITLYFINRYLRLIPCLAVLILLGLASNKPIEPGPLLEMAEEQIEVCRRNWWSNLLCIHNYYDPGNMCAPHSWYLAADIQLYLVSLLILGVIWKFPKYTYLIFGISLSIAVLIPASISYVNDYELIIRVYPKDVTLNALGYVESLRAMYVPAHTNMGAYIVGLIFGYIFYKTRHQLVFTKKYHVYLWYVMVMCPPLLTVVIQMPSYAEDYVNNRLLAAIFAGISKTAVGFSIALLIYGVSQGVGGILRDILCWAPFQVLGKLCYCVYVFHFIIPIGRSAEDRFPSFIHLRLQVWQMLGDLTSAFMLALVASLCIELPMQSLQKIYVPQVNKKRRAEKVQ